MSRFPLEPDDAAMRQMGRAVVDTLADFVSGLPEAPAADLAGADELVSRALQPPGEEPGDFATLLAGLRDAAHPAVDTAAPGFLAYVPGGGLYTAALGELLARGVNRYTGVADLAPAQVGLEEGVLRWLCREFGLPDTAQGVVTTGGSMATLTALAAARDRVLDEEEVARGTLYVTEHTHGCVAQAAHTVGFPRARVRVVPTGPDRRIDLGEAARMIAADRADGLLPAVLVGTAGTTDTGAVDDLTGIADLAAREQVWCHVDAAYGGFFRLTGRGRERLRGIERADSVVLDPHKGLFLPYGTGVLLVRDRAALEQAFGGEAAYLQDLEGSDGLPDYRTLTPELTRESRGPRLWLPLHLHGVAAFRSALDEKLDLATEAYESLAADPRLETDGPPDLSVVTCRLRDGDEADHRQWLARVNASGRVYLSSTRLDGRFTLRLCVLSHRTHADRLGEAVEVIRRAVPHD